MFYAVKKMNPLDGLTQRDESKPGEFISKRWAQCYKRLAISVVDQATMIRLSCEDSSAPRTWMPRGLSTLGTNPTQLRPLTAQQLTERLRKLLKRSVIDVASDDDSMSTLSDDGCGNFIAIDEADDHEHDHSMHACMADMGGDGTPADGDDEPGAPGTGVGAAGQTASVTFGADSSPTGSLHVPGFLRALNVSHLGDINSQSSSDEASPPPLRRVTSRRRRQT